MSELNVIIGLRLKELREHVGVSQDEIAHVMGYQTRVTIGRIERGETGCNVDTISNFLKLYNSKIKDFFNFDYPHHDESTHYIPLIKPELKVDVLQENHALLRENSRLKTLLLQHKLPY